MTRGTAFRLRDVIPLALLTALLSAVVPASAQAAATRLVRYHGYAVRVPRSWTVYNLTHRPETCVRFDRHAVYLGTPSSAQRCPAHAAGRTEAILITPVSRQAAVRAPRSASAVSAHGLAGRSTSFLVASAGVEVTATWASAPAVVAAALHRSAVPASSPAAEPAAPRSATPRAAKAHAASAVYTGLGFDDCSAPSAGAMSAWSASPYRAVGVYIGGANTACAQPNLTSGWVASEVAAGWGLIPTYVGLQAPSNRCGCASITPGQASAQGTAAAADAVADAQAIGIPAGNPIYFDMEAYTRNSANTSAVLAFLSAWTAQLHALGYLSGIYSSAASGMVDLVQAIGTSFVAPDEIWVAEWNGSQSTVSDYVPAADWSNHQRIHQYSGSHDETYGGVTLNIDGDALDGATAGTSSIPASFPTPPAQSAVAPTPTLTVSPTFNGLTNFSASWSGATGIVGWRVLGGVTSGALATVASAGASRAVTVMSARTAAPYYELQALGPGNQVLGSSPLVTQPAHLAIFGKSAFVPGLGGGMGGLPVGCYTGSRCTVRTTLAAGRTVVARTGPEFIGSETGGFVYFRLTPAGLALLRRARGGRLPVLASVRDATSGKSASATITVIPFGGGKRPALAHGAQAPTVRFVGLSDYVNGGVGGILAGCRGVPVCNVTTTLSAGRTVIARTGTEQIGANELGYLIFTLTPQGRALLTRASGNSVLVRAVLSMNAASAIGAASATATISLVRYR
ncbi:MAG: DUF1906 domain-containing protein [Solirubrobacterales bacterium]|nr:DUF1906 domain-containing protein [Solirubrobacterales bacterium]